MQSLLQPNYDATERTAETERDKLEKTPCPALLGIGDNTAAKILEEDTWFQRC